MRAPLTIPAILALLAACGGAEPDSTPQGVPTVAVTLPPVASLARAVGGTAVHVVTLLPPGAHPDSYEVTPRVAQALAGAALVVRVGGAADAWLGTLGNTAGLVLTDDMRLRGRQGPGTGNPHVWLDPILVRDRLLPRLVDALARVAPDDADHIRSRGRAFADSLTALDAEIRAMLVDVEGRRFVSAHPAWVYFAERYDLESVGSVHASPGSELGARELARLVDATRTDGVRAVIAEPQLGRAGVDALAQELGVRVEVADAVGGEGLESREDYLSLMRFNARAFARALGRGGIDE